MQLIALPKFLGMVVVHLRTEADAKTQKAPGAANTRGQSEVLDITAHP